MTIIVFLIDTSASMNQRLFIGARPTMLDLAKGAVESFVKLRQRSPESRGDRYMLFTFEEPPCHIKAGWKENLATFMNELKNIKATGLSTLGPAIKNVFDVLNINRMQSGIDTYGTGRSPFYLEPSVIIVITDGGRLSSAQGMQDDIFPLPKTNPIPGAELTREIFRWDQRLFGLVLRMTGTPSPDPMGLVPSDNSPLDRLCEQTGGRSYAIRSHRMFQQCIDSLVQKVQSGVVISFEKIGPDPPPVNADGHHVLIKTNCLGKEAPDIVEVDKENQQNNLDTSQPEVGLMGGGGMLGSILQNSNSRPHTPNSLAAPMASNSASSNAWHNCRKMIYVLRSTQRGSPAGFWPIPESFWPDVNTLSLPARSAHPNVKFTCTSQEPMVIDNLPFDKYELEPSPLTQYILSRKQPTICWQVYISNSSRNNDVGHPFGYLKASTSLQCVNLFVMPYNYPVLLPLLDELFKTHRLKPTKEWRVQFESYLRTMPPYYAIPLKRALGRMGAPNLVPETLDNSLSFQVTNHLKRLKNQAKLEYERICLEVDKRLSQNQSSAHEGIRVQPRRPLSRNLMSNHTLKDKLSHLRDQVTDYSNFLLAVCEGEVNPQMYRNPFDIPRSRLLDQLARMRANFLQASPAHMLTDRDQDQLHCKPIGQMGNYQDYLKKMTPPLREIELAPVRQHMFGNPFKIDKKMSMMVDEADVDLVSAGSGGTTGGGGRGSKRAAEFPSSNVRPNKRKRGPLPMDVTLQRVVSLSRSPPDSPAPHRGAASGSTPRASAAGDEGRDTPRPDTPTVFSSPGYSSPPSTLSSPYSHPSYPSMVSPSYYGGQDDKVMPVGVNANSHGLVNGDVLPSLPLMRDDDLSSNGEDSDLDVALPPISYTPEINEDESEERSPGPQDDNRSNLSTNSGTPSPPSSPLPSAPSSPVPPPVPQSDTPATKSYNRQLLGTCYKEVKKPGRDFGRLFEKLNTVQGSYDSKLRLIKDVTFEASRFKRHYLVKLLTRFLDSMIASENLNQVPQSIRVNGHSK
ncbi:integrator complex subunit 6 isoform X2 [Oratosquilla oratoria]|uniref:integrator complex subunit 6 isoform X2 n=1 Tax=Oratosquilla oratoria TaxID=337810 RepID=UPI003F775F4D